jgi:hypothetical protein
MQGYFGWDGEGKNLSVLTIERIEWIERINRFLIDPHGTAAEP